MRICSGAVAALGLAFNILHAAEITTTVPNGSAVQADQLADVIKAYETESVPRETVLKSFQDLAAAGDPRATMWIARSHFKGRCSAKLDPDLGQQMAEQVIAQIKQRAERGDIESEFLLGSAYYEGLAVEVDCSEAAKWYQKCVNAGHITAMNNFANMIAHGQVPDADIDRARQLFSEAAKAGSRLAAKNLEAFKDDGRDDTQRLVSLRTNILVKALGMQLNDGIAFLHQHGMITDPQKFRTNRVDDLVRYHFRIDGVLISAGPTGRITNVEGHSKGFRGSRQFQGGLPLGIQWDFTRQALREYLGRPDDSGCVQSDGAYGMAYRTENVFLAVMFENQDDGKVLLWRVHEKWAVNYD